MIILQGTNHRPIAISAKHVVSVRADVNTIGSLKLTEVHMSTGLLFLVTQSVAEVIERIEEETKAQGLSVRIEGGGSDL